MTQRIVAFLAPVLTALSLVPGGAHLLAMPNKMRLNEADYFTVQQIYNGWALLGILLFATLAVTLLLAILQRRRPTFWLALGSFLLVAANLAIFFIWTFPTNQATRNWTVAPPNWEALRAQWEYSHAANAGVMFLAFCLAVAASLKAAQR
jgi:hypothetical protein